MNHQDYQRGYDDGYAAAMSNSRNLKMDNKGHLSKSDDSKEAVFVRDKPKKIEKLNFPQANGSELSFYHNDLLIAKKVDQLIDRLNQE